MLLKLYQAGQPILRQPAKQVSKQQLRTSHVQAVIDFMITTLRDAPGVGLAAPQIGEALQIIIIEDKANYHETVPPELLKEQGRKPIALKVLVNPTLEVINTDTAWYFEGCLSVDGYVGVVPRHKAVKVTAWDRHGKEVTYVTHGWQARILQHEIDHLAGKLYLETMTPKSFTSLKNFTMLWRTALEQDITKVFRHS
jgi:peptide deformylase